MSNRIKFNCLWFVHPCLLTYSTEQSPSWEANRFLAIQEIPHILWTPKVHYLIHKCPTPVPILSLIDPGHKPHPTSWRSIYAWVFQVVSVPQVSPPKHCVHLSSPHHSIVLRKATIPQSVFSLHKLILQFTPVEFWQNLNAHHNCELNGSPLGSIQGQ
jgi:hypothetical protein